MGSYKIELILAAKDAMSSAMSSAGNNVKAGLDKIKSESSSTTSTLIKGADKANTSVSNISKGASAASKGLSTLKTQGASAFGTLKSGASAAKNELGDLGTLVTGLAGGIGAMEVIQTAWTGATTKEFNAAYLQTKMSTSAAQDYIKEIQTIVAEVPGDDTFMNNLMTGAVAKQTNLTSGELKKLGIATADYLVTSQAMGKSAIETQMDLKEYILTGNTTQLERDSILKQQLDTLEDQGTVSERINALNKALVDEGYSGLSQLDIASIKWEEIKGKLQMAATNVGEKLLPYIEDVLDFVIDLDTKTDGWSTTLAFMVGTAGLLATALAPVVSAGVAAYNAMKLYRMEAEEAAIANAANKGPGTAGTTTSTLSKATSFAGDFALGPLAALSLSGGEIAAGGGLTTGAMAGVASFGTAIGLATGHFLNLMDDWFEAGGEVSNNLWNFTKGIQGLTNPLAALFNPLQKGADIIYDLFTGDFQGAIQDVISYLKAPFGDWGMGGIFQQLTGPLTSFKDGLVDFVSNTWSDFKGAVTIVGQALNQVWIVLGPAINEIGAAFGDVGSAFGDVWTELSSAASELGSALGEVWSPLQEAFGELWEALFPVSDASKDLAPEIKKAKPEFNLLIDGAKWLAEGIRAATPYVVTFAGYIRTGAGYIKRFADFIRDVSEGIHDFKGNIKNFKLPTAGDVIKWIRSKLASITGSLNLTTLFTHGLNLIRSKIAKISGKFNITTLMRTATAWVQTKVNRIVGEFNISLLATNAAAWAYSKVSRITGSFSLTNLGTKVYNFIKSIIPPFTWPWGPASTGSGSGGGGGGAFYGPPRGPIKDTIVSTMASRSGVGSGYIASAMANRFSGLGGFNPIADGMAAPLSYSFYYGDQKTNEEVWRSGQTNCYDGAQFLMSEGNRFGLGGGLSNGVWDGTSIPHTWAVIGGQPFDMAAKLIRGFWNPPSGPAGDFAQFMTDIGPALEYVGYGGHLMNPLTALDSGGNCFDMTLGIMDVASTLFGLPSEMMWGTYDGNSHVWARIANRDYDLSRRALAGTYSPPPQGPGSSKKDGGIHFHEGAIKLEGTFVGMEHYKKEIKRYANEAMEEAADKYNMYDFG